MKNTEETYRQLFYNYPLPMWMVDMETQAFSEVNNAALKQYGYDRDGFLSMNITGLFHVDEVEKFKNEMAAFVKDGHSQRGTWRHVKKNGELINVEVTMELVDPGGKQIVLFVSDGIAQDAASLNELNEQLKKRAEELTVSNEELESFAYIASHDLQEPLRMVSSFLKLLEKKYRDQLDETARKYIHFAVDGSDRMRRLIMDLLEYSRVGTSQQAPEPVDMNKVVTDTLATCTVTIAKTGAKITAGDLPVINAHKTQMLQVTQNLVGNALKYCSGEHPPEIHIEAYDKGTHWLFAVSDNGIGIDPVNTEKIFVIFQRLHNRDEYSGTGIGLAIARKIVRKHGGEIWVEPNQPAGSIFYFSIKK